MGILGIVFAICCPIVGIIFAVLSMMEAKKSGKPPTLAYVGFAIAGVVIVINIILAAAGALPGT